MSIGLLVYQLLGPVRSSVTTGIVRSPSLYLGLFSHHACPYHWVHQCLGSGIASVIAVTGPLGLVNNQNACHQLLIVITGALGWLTLGHCLGFVWPVWGLRPPGWVNAIVVTGLSHWSAWSPGLGQSNVCLWVTPGWSLYHRLGVPVSHRRTNRSPLGHQ